MDTKCTHKEYPLLKHALVYNVRGTMALPVFEPTRQSCICVVELIMTTQKINFGPEIDKMCKALEVTPLVSIISLIRMVLHFDH